MLFTLGGVFSMVEGYEKLTHPEELSSIWWAVGVLVGAIVLELFSFRTAIRESAAAKGEQSWWSFVRTAKTPELPVVLLEDLGALAGFFFALGGIGLAELTHNPRFDALGSIAIGVLLAGIGLLVAFEVKGLLIGESPRPRTPTPSTKLLARARTYGVSSRCAASTSGRKSSSWPPRWSWRAT